MSEADWKELADICEQSDGRIAIVYMEDDEDEGGYILRIGDNAFWNPEQFLEWHRNSLQVQPLDS